jgi:hypothetical protein
VQDLAVVARHLRAHLDVRVTGEHRFFLPRRRRS